MTEVGNIASQTLQMLEERLNRVRFHLYGDSGDTGNYIVSDTNHAAPESPILVRLENLEKSLNSLKTQLEAVSQILQICG